MIQFIKMIETIRTYGIIGITEPGKPGRFVPSVGFWDEVAKCQPFVFKDHPHTTKGKIVPLPQNERLGWYTSEKLDAPFPVFSIEKLDGPAIETFALDGKENQVHVDIWCILVMEKSPKVYSFLTLLSPHGRPEECQVSASNNEGPIVEEYLQLLKTQKMGIEQVRQNVKLGTGKEKRMHRIRKIIHVSSKKYISTYVPTGRTVNWSHRWEVRGTWVSLPGGLGKDRDGNYCVKDWTWRVHHTKGPDHLPLVKKTRIVEQGDDDER